ncbi:hypothetical protein Tco_0593873 [Tanacetum coccineum]
MDGRGVGSAIVLGSAPSAPYFSVSLLVRLLDVDRGGAGKGGSRVLASDLVVMSKFSASGSGDSLFPIMERIWEICCIASEMEETFMFIPHIVLVLDVFFYSIPSFFFSERAEAEMGEFVEFHMVVPRYVIVKDLYQKPFLYSMMGNLLN